MTIQDFATLLAGTGYDVAYDHFLEQDAPECPYICYKRVSTANAMADNDSAYVGITQMQVALYTKTVNLTAEATVETAIGSLPYTKEFEFDDDEDIHITYYTVNLI